MGATPISYVSLVKKEANLLTTPAPYSAKLASRLT